MRREEAQQEPPFWQAKLHGEAYGRNFKQQRAAPPQHTVQVEIRPGVLHRITVACKQGAGAAAGHKVVAAARPASAVLAAAAAVKQSQCSPGALGHQQRPQQQPSAHACAAALAAPAGRPCSAPAGTGSQQQPQQPQQQLLLDVYPELPALEDQMRCLLRTKAALHTKEKVLLLSTFAKVLGRPSAAAVSAADKVSIRQFVHAWQLLGLPVSSRHASALFSKFGHDARGLLPVSVFTEALMTGGPRQLMLLDGATVQQGPYKAGRPATHTGKILYPQCKSGVWPPSDWDPAVAERSSRLPAAQLELEFVYGVDRHRATSSNIAVNCQGRLVYFAAAVCIVYDPNSHSQTFFRGHDDDICCLALAADRRIAASGQLGRDATVLVWDSVRLVQLAKLQHGPGSRGIQALCFSGSGSRLATIATDNSHSISIWDWSREIRLLEQKTQPGAPPAVYGVVWSRFQPERLASFGQNHLKFWSLTQQQQADGRLSGDSSLTVESGVFGRVTHSVLSAVFLPSGTVLTGAPDGSICSWSGARCTRRTPAHALGPPTSRPDGSCSHGGVSCLVLMEDGKTLISGGADGHVLKWDVSGGDLGACLQRLPLLAPQQQQQRALDTAAGGVTGAAPLLPAIKALDTVPGRADTFIAGTSAADVWEVDGDPRVLLRGQQGEVVGVATNPHYPHVFATVSGAGKVSVWNAATHQPIRIFPVGAGMSGTAVSFSTDGRYLLVGLSNGGLKEFAFSPETKQVWWCKAFGSRVDVVQYSPDGSSLAAAGHDRAIDIFTRKQHEIQQRTGSSTGASDDSRDWVRTVRCVGHSSAVKSLDWSADGCCLQSADQAYELLCFDAASGRQLKGSCRDTRWASYTCCLGFPAMAIWPPDSDGTDINALDRSPGGDLLITADDKGKDAPGRCYGGHSSHVMGVRWAANQAYAVSVGGHDRAVFQWRLLLPPSKAERRRQLMKQQKVFLRPVSPDGVMYE